MNKIVQKLFLTNLIIIAAGSILLGAILGIPSSNYFTIAILSFFIAILLTITVKRIFLKPIEKMQMAAEKITRGEYQTRLSVHHNDEFKELADNLNEMSSELQNRITEITRDKNELKAILASMVEGVMVIGRDEKILLLSDPLSDMLELRSSQVIGKPYWEIIRNGQINSLIEEAISQKRAAHREITVLSPVDSYFNVQVSPVISEDSKDFWGIVAVFHDITSLKKLEQLKSEFVANVSHELKTPLTTIKGFVETLQEGALEDKEKAHKFLEIIQKHAERLEHLVNDILTLSSIESQEIELTLERTPVDPLINSAINICKEHLEKRRHHLIVNIAKDLPNISVDKSKIEQAFVNLLDNAIKFTQPGGSLTINAYQENGFIRIDFKDTGIGIASAHLPRIFERFYRVDKGRSRELGGTGLGLSIVKNIAQLHAGKIMVQSETGQGSVFSFCLPPSAKSS